MKIQDFMALELQQGYAVLYMDYGTGTVRLDQRHIKLTDGKSHKIDIYFTKNVNTFYFLSSLCYCFYQFFFNIHFLCVLGD